MKCIVCHNGETHPGTTTMTFDRPGSTVIIRGVPAEICENCGEAYLDEQTTEQLLTAVASARKSGAEVLIREYAPA